MLGSCELALTPPWFWQCFSQLSNSGHGCDVFIVDKLRSDPTPPAAFCNLLCAPGQDNFWHDLSGASVNLGSILPTSGFGHEMQLAAADFPSTHRSAAL